MTPLKGIKMRITINEKEYESGKITRENTDHFVKRSIAFWRKMLILWFSQMKT